MQLVGDQGGTWWRMRLYKTIGGTKTYLPAIADYVNLQGDNGDTHYPCTSQIDSPAYHKFCVLIISGTRWSGSGNLLLQSIKVDIQMKHNQICIDGGFSIMSELRTNRIVQRDGNHLVASVVASFR